MDDTVDGVLAVTNTGYVLSRKTRFEIEGGTPDSPIGQIRSIPFGIDVRTALPEYRLALDWASGAGTRLVAGDIDRIIVCTTESLIPDRHEPPHRLLPQAIPAQPAGRLNPTERVNLMRTRHAVLSGLATLAVVGAAVGSRADAAPEVPWGQRPVTVGSGLALASTPSQDVLTPAPAVTASGRWVVFATRAALDPNDIDGEPDVYLRDRWTDLTRLLPGEGFILNLAVSAGGSYTVSSREVRDPELGPQ